MTDSPLDMEDETEQLRQAVRELIHAAEDYAARFGYKRKWTVEAQMLYDAIMRGREALGPEVEL